MEFISLKIDGFGKFRDLSMDFSEGLNVIYGHNEAGKSTLHSFLRSMLFGIDRKPGIAARNDLRDRYTPWEAPDFGGELRFSFEGKRYILRRDFREMPAAPTILEEETERAVPEPEKLLQQALNGITETAYINTVSIGQLKCATGREMVRELRGYLESIQTTGDASLNAVDALRYLDAQKAKLNAKRVPDAARSYAALTGEIKNLEREIAAPEYENQLNHFAALKDSARGELKDRQTRKEELLQKTAQQETVLRQAGFPEGTALSEEKERAEQLYTEVQNDEKGGKNARQYLPLAAFAGGILFLMLMVLSAVSGSRNFAAMLGIESFYQNSGLAAGLRAFPLPASLLVVLSLVLSVLLFIEGGVLLSHSRAAAAEKQKKREALAQILRKQLASDSISEEAMTALRARFAELENIGRELTENQKALSDLCDALNSLTEEEKRCDEALQEQQNRQRDLEEKLQHLGNIKNRAEQLKRALRENDRISEKLDALELAEETLTELSREIRLSFGHYLNEEAAGLISIITNGAYDSIWIDNDLNVSLNLKDQLVPIDQVSSGTMDQIYLALRLSAARLLQADKAEKLPLVLDDSFVMYDEDRLRAALHFIESQYPGQVLLFTCHRREEKLLEADKIPFHRIELA